MNPEHAPPDHFVTTRWTQVLAARGNSGEAREALRELCAAYYDPVIAFLRREQKDEDAARELAHEFFATVLEGDAFSHADPQRGRFRSYLLGALKHFSANRRARSESQRRGGKCEHLPLPSEGETTHLSLPSAPALEPDPVAAFDRDWALKVIERALGRLRQEWEAKGALSEFEALKPELINDRTGEGSPTIAERLAMNEGAARVRLHRFRRRFGDLVKSEIAQTVHGPAEVAEEMRHLIAALSR